MKEIYCILLPIMIQLHVYIITNDAQNGLNLERLQTNMNTIVEQIYCTN